MKNKWQNKYKLYNEAYGSRDFQLLPGCVDKAEDVAHKLSIQIKKIEDDPWSTYYGAYTTEFVVTATGAEAVKLIDEFKKAEIKGKYYDGLLNWYDI